MLNQLAARAYGHRVAPCVGRVNANPRVNRAERGAGAQADMPGAAVRAHREFRPRDSVVAAWDRAAGLGCKRRVPPAEAIRGVVDVPGTSVFLHREIGPAVAVIVRGNGARECIAVARELGVPAAEAVPRIINVPDA